MLPPAHMLWGLTAWAALSPRPRARLDARRRAWLWLAVALAALVPDLDWLAAVFLPPEAAYGLRHGFSHGLGTALLVGGLCWAGFSRREGWRALVAWVMVVWVHGWVDAVCADGHPPYGVQLFWPFSADRFLWPVFPELRTDLATMLHGGDVGGLLAVGLSPRLWGMLVGETALALLALGLVLLARFILWPPRPWVGVGLTPQRFLLFRTYNLTLGAFGWGAELLRRLLVRVLVEKSSGPRYCQSARYFTPDQLDPAPGGRDHDEDAA